MFQQVREPQGLGQATQVFKQLHSLRQLLKQLGLQFAHAREVEVLQSAGIVEEGDDSVAGSGEGAGGVQHALEDGVEVQAFVDAQTGLTEPEEPVAEGRIFLNQVFAFGRYHYSPKLGQKLDKI